MKQGWAATVPTPVVLSKSKNGFSHMVFSRFLAAKLALLGLVLSTHSQAQDGSWVRECDEEKCSLVRPLVEQGSNRRVATFLALVRREEALPVIGVAMPLGVALMPGVRVVLENTTMELPFQVCFPDGCRSLREVTRDEFDALSTADTLDIRFFPYASEKPVSVTMPLSGFKQAIDAARAELAQP